MTWRKNLFLVLVGVAVVLALLGLLVFGIKAQAEEGERQAGLSSVSDTVDFSAELQAGDKDPEVVGQYAQTTINGQVVKSEYSTEPRPMETRAFGIAGDGCAYGGAGTGCLEGENIADAATRAGAMNPLDEDFVGLLGIGLATTAAEVTESFSTGAKCSLDGAGVPSGTAFHPTGAVLYGSPNLLSLQQRTVDVGTLPSDQTWSDSWKVGAVLGLLGLLSGTTVEVEITPSFGWDDEALRAHSELAVRYRGLNGDDVRPWITFTARSECGMLMSDDTGSSGPAGEQAQSLAAPQAFGLADPETTETSDPESSPTPAPNDGQPTTAPGAPQQSGFTEESSLATANGVDYHLLSTRELDLLDREVIADVLTATRETGAVQGETATARWWLYSAEAADGEVPVLEIELADGAIVQARPNLPGVQYPTPDLTISATPTTTTGQPSEPTVEQTSEPATEQPTTSQMAAAPEETGEEAADE